MRKIILGIAILSQLNVFAQTNTDLRPQVKSPEVNKFEQYINMPVNLVSGTPQVSIPIYTLEYGGMSLPISLEYDASGVKVESIASCVGQNWTLNVGGVLSRIVKGAPDEGNPYNSQASSFIDIDGFYQDYGLTKLESQLNQYPANTYNGNEVFNRAIQLIKWSRDLGNGFKDSQPDFFYFSTPQGGSKFVFNDQRQVTYLENTDFIIKENFGNNDFKSWLVTSPSGIKYKFGIDNPTGYQGRGNVCEASYNLAEGPFDWNGGAVNRFIVNSWFLTEMKNFLNNKKIQLSYIDNEYKQIVNTTQSKFTENCLHYDANGNITPGNSGCPNEESQYNSFAQETYSYDFFNTGNCSPNMQGRPNSSFIVHSKLISQIIAGTTQINFTYSLRSDLQDEWNPDLTGGKKLDKIEIIENSVCVKKIVFNYTTTRADEIVTNGSVREESRKRFFLTNFTETSCDDKITKPYSFEYNSTPLPNRMSYAQDKWGYYNGKINNLSLFAKFHFSDEPGTYTADRKIDFNFAKAGSLEKIIYPTIGTVNFEYEPHLANDANDYFYNPIPTSIIVSDLQPQPQGVFTSPSNTTTFTYNLNSTQILSLTCSLMFPNPMQSLGTYCNDKVSNTAAEIIDNVTNQVIAFVWYTPFTNTSKKIYIDPAKFVSGRSYTLRVLGSECYHNMSTLSIHDIVPIYEVGGLRIKKITHKNYDNTIVKEMNYTYANAKTVTTHQKAIKIHFNYLQNLNSLNGLISASNINYINTYYKAQAGYNWDNEDSFFYFVSSGIDFYDFNFIGPHITYGKVFETNGSGNGKIEYNFNYYKNYFEMNGFAQPTHPAPPRFQSTLAGEKMSEITWGNSSDLKTNRNVFNYSINNTTITGIRFISYGNACQEPGVLLNAYTLQGQTKTLQSETETTNLNNNTITNTTEYEYNGNGHNQPTKITTTDNQGNQSLITNLTYPLDIPSPDPYIRRLILENRKETPIKTEYYRGTEKISEQTTEYEIYPSDAAGTYLTLPKFVYSKKGNEPSNPLEKKVTYNYDTHGNLIEYTPENGVTTSIIWGYNNTQPIAKLENCVYATIAISTINNLKNLSNNNNEANLLNELNNLRAALPNAMVSSYTYKPLIGISTMTDAKGDKMTYEYDEFNRLKWVKDKEGNILSEKQYHYKK